MNKKKRKVGGAAKIGSLLVASSIIGTCASSSCSGLSFSFLSYLNPICWFCALKNYIAELFESAIATMTASKDNNEIFKFKQRIFDYVCKESKKYGFEPASSSDLQAANGEFFYLQRSFVFFEKKLTLTIGVEFIEKSKKLKFELLGCYTNCENNCFELLGLDFCYEGPWHKHFFCGEKVNLREGVFELHNCSDDVLAAYPLEYLFGFSVDIYSMIQDLVCLGKKIAPVITVNENDVNYRFNFGETVSFNDNVGRKLNVKGLNFHTNSRGIDGNLYLVIDEGGKESTMSFNFMTDNKNDKIGYSNLKKAISEQLSIDFEKNTSSISFNNSTNRLLAAGSV